MNFKEKFYELMHEYFEKKIVREIYNSDDMCILNFSDLFYLGCPYFSAEDGKTFGMMLGLESVPKIVKDNNLYFETLKSLDAITLDKITIDLSLENLPKLQEWLKSQVSPSKFVNYALEEEIMNMTKNKSK